MSEFLTYRTFFDLEEAEQYRVILDDNGIESKIERYNSNAISLITTQGPEEYVLLIPDDKVAEADKLVDIPKEEPDIENHPLQQYSDEELYNILYAKDEWEVSEVSLAKEILKSRGEDVSDKHLEELAGKRLNELKQTKDGKILVYIGGFLVAGLGFYAGYGYGLLGWIVYAFGIGVGLNYHLNKRKLPNGDKTYVYAPKTRLMGFLIILINILSLLFGLAVFYQLVVF
ncbi:MAG: hypothetical protein MI922_04215 [Bacteroidales bacterium]|nr:hypothetical protein [Bacteroidales bacterium]